MKRNWSPIAAMCFFLGLFLLLSIIASALGLNGHSMPLNESQVLYLFSTSAQVIAGIYGLTLTGFVFFRNELSREEFEDETLVDAVESLKKRYFSLLVFITAFVLLTLLLSNLAISYEGFGRFQQSTIIVNVGQSAFVTSLFAIAYFVFDVTSPKRIESASQKLQDQLDPSRSDLTKGSLESFLRNYNEIELLLSRAGFSYQDSISLTYEKRLPRRLPNSKLAQTLYRNGKIDKLLFTKLRDLISLRNSIIHGADPVVSQDKVDASTQILQELRSAFDVNDDVR